MRAGKRFKKRYPEIRLLKGDSNLLVIQTLLRTDRERCAIVMDGPKGILGNVIDVCSSGAGVGAIGRTP